MIMTPFFNSDEIEKIINNPNELSNYLKNNINENSTFNMMSNDEEGEEYEYEDEYEGEESEEENDVENMSDKEKVKLAYEILSMTSYEDEFFMGILGRLRKIMRQ